MLSIRAAPVDCPADPPNPDQAQLLSSGDSTHHVLEILTVAGTAITGFLACGLILSHLLTYRIPTQQRQIIRLVAVPFVYAVVSLLQTYFYNAAEYLRPIADLYEAFALVSLLMLFAHFIESASGPRNQVSNGQEKAYSAVQFQYVWILVFQYPIVRIITLVVTEASLASGRYCTRSSNLHFASVWVTIIDTISVTLAVGSILKFYLGSRAQMTGHNPGYKLLAFKIIVFVSFLQNLIFKLLDAHGALQSSTYVSYFDISRGIPAVLICVESVLFASFDVFAFTPTEYMARGLQTNNPAAHLYRRHEHSSENDAEMESMTPLPKKLPFGTALISALDPRDILQGFGIAFAILCGAYPNTA